MLAVSSLPPANGVEELASALDQHRAGLDMDAVRARMRRLAALSAFAAERGERGMRALGGRRQAEKLLASLDGNLTVPEMVAALERDAAG